MSSPGGDPQFQRLRPSEHVVSSRLGDVGLLVHLKTNQIFELNTTGLRVWELIGEGLGFEEVVGACCALSSRWTSSNAPRSSRLGERAEAGGTARCRRRGLSHLATGRRRARGTQSGSVTLGPSSSRVDHDPAESALAERRHGAERRPRPRAAICGIAEDARFVVIFSGVLSNAREMEAGRR